MKTFYLILLAFLIGSTGVTDAQRKNKTTQDSLSRLQFQKMMMLVESNRFQIDIDQVYPLNGSDLTRFNPEGTITVTDSIAKGKLPYFGRAYNLPYGGGGIEFDNPVKDREIKAVEKKKKTSVFYKFSVSGKDDVYRFSIDIFPNGTCSVNLNSNNRRNISYSGKIKELNDEKK